MIEVREMTPEDEFIYDGWWEKKNGFKIDSGTFGGIGLIVLLDGKPIFGGRMIIFHDFKSAFITFLTVNPETDNKERSQTFNFLIDGFNKLAKDLGVKNLMTATNVASLGNRLEDSGFLKADMDVVHYFKKV